MNVLTQKDAGIKGFYKGTAIPKVFTTDKANVQKLEKLVTNPHVASADIWESICNQQTRQHLCREKARKMLTYHKHTQRSSEEEKEKKEGVCVFNW